MRFTADTNVLVSALVAAGPPSRIIEETINGRLQLALLAPVLGELHRILTVKLGFEESRWEEADALLRGLSLEVFPAPNGPVEAITGDPDDDVILACAVEAQVGVLISGDRKHLLPVGSYRGTRIETPQAILAELRGN